jgi:hypothetical protein
MIKTHEAGHVAISARWLKTLRSRLVGVRQSCTNMTNVFDETVSEANAAQEAYDKVQYSTQVFPTPPD